MVGASTAIEVGFVFADREPIMATDTSFDQSTMDSNWDFKSPTLLGNSTVGASSIVATSTIAMGHSDSNS